MNGTIGTYADEKFVAIVAPILLRSSKMDDCDDCLPCCIDDQMALQLITSSKNTSQAARVINAKQQHSQ